MEGECPLERHLIKRLSVNEQNSYNKKQQRPWVCFFSLANILIQTKRWQKLLKTF